MPREIMDRLWALYGEYVRDIEHGAEVARRAFGIQRRDFFKIHYLTQEEFEACVVAQGGDPQIRTNWLSKILAFAASDDERRRLGQALDLPETTPVSGSNAA